MLLPSDPSRAPDPAPAEGSARGWLRPSGEGSLAEVHGSVAVGADWKRWRRFVAFLGPGYLVAVGYMDPGNWATSLAGGAKYGYQLLFVALVANVMAIVLQSLAARLAVGARRDLAQACRDALPQPVAAGLWLAAELAIIATDLAEVIGTAIGLNLLFGLPLAVGVIITAADVFLVLYLQAGGFRRVEAMVVSFLIIIALSFLAQIILANPDWAGVASGFLPRLEIVTDPGMLYLALGILGATVMPHNLYLHSGIVQTRAIGDSEPQKREALKFATIDSTIALMLALMINGAILVLAAAAFNASGNEAVESLDQAHSLLHPLLGSAVAPVLFAIALIACGLNSTVTATLAGQIVMEGFLNLRIPPAARRLVTRGLAIIPAAGVTIFAGEAGTAKLLILSQVVLSLQLPFAVIPLVAFTADKKKLGGLAAPRWLTVLAALIAAIIVVLNAKLVYDFVTG
ncbi:MAG: Nramp family divalent metal transporter [Bauldia sp.]